MRRLAVALGAVIALLLAAAPAGAFVSGEFGLQQRKPVWVRHGPLQYHAGKVIHASDSYAIYWDPLELYNSEWMRTIDKYFQNVGTASGSLGNVFALNAQYGETGYSTQPSATPLAKEAHAADQSTFRGAYTDTTPYPSSGCIERAEVACLTDAQIKTELQKVIKSGALPGATGTVPGAKSTPVYYILTPPGVTVCAGASSPSTCSNSGVLENEANEIKEAKVSHPAETGICGYHSWTEPEPKKPIVYAVQPWVAGYAGLFVESVSPLLTSGTSADVLACQDNKSLEEPNQQSGLNPFAIYGGGLADVIVNDLADEQTNVVVNPLLTGWYQNAAAAEKGYPEQGDMCQFGFGTSEASSTPTESPTHAGSASNETIGSGQYYIHWAFNSSGFLTGKDTAACWQGVSLEPHITAPNPVNVGDVVGLDANESGITLDAAPLDLRQGKEETRLGNEVATLGAEETRLGAEIIKLGKEETRLGNEIAELSAEELELSEELKQLEKEEARVATEEANLARERNEAEAKHELTKEKEKAFAATEKGLAEERKRIAEHKAAAEQKSKSDKESKSAAEKANRADHERKLVVEEDKVIVTEDKPLAKEEEKLAKEHKLIKEREPFLAPIYKWDFGYQEDGKEVTEEGEEKASVFHTFPCAKAYTVELTVVDGGGNEAGLPASVTKEITVDGNPCEEKGKGEGEGKGEGKGGTTPPTKPPLPPPVATAAAVSHSLRSVLKKGLVISYSVNEQVAGQFQVLLASSIARRIGLHGASATGLPPGTAPQTVIAKAILITTKGGRNTVKILFGKKTAAKLRKLHKVTLMIRLVVRNASSHSPLSTTVLSTVTLSH